jgi:hypothetical protein
MRIRLAGLGLILLPLTSLAHHSVAGTFDGTAVVELEGKLTRISWQNPHIHFTLVATDAAGQQTTWEVESTSLSNLRRWEVTPDFMKVGDYIKVAGNPSKRDRKEIFALNVLLPDGTEVPLGPMLKPVGLHWSNSPQQASREVLASAGDPSHPELGIYRVWSTPVDAPMLFPENVDPNFDFASYPLTPAARASVASFDPFTDSPILNCTPKGMPTVMEEPYPMEFVRDGDNIRLRLEEYDTVRTIYMNAAAVPSTQPATRVGTSTGRWEGNTLVVTTQGTDWRAFDVVGIPQSAAATFVERFTLAPDGSRLDYTITANDPANFTAPVTLKKYWIWIPGVEISPYRCTVTP